MISGRRRRSLTSFRSPASSFKNNHQADPLLPPQHQRQHPLQWKLSQVLGGGDTGDHSTLEDDTDVGDFISAVEFDATGEFLAVGDGSGRVILFRMANKDHRIGSWTELPTPAPPPPRYAYMTEFQSHKMEFDTLSSVEIREKIVKLRFCTRPNNRAHLILSANEQTVKLWKVSEARAAHATPPDSVVAASIPVVRSESELLRAESFRMAEDDDDNGAGAVVAWTNKKQRGELPRGTGADSELPDFDDGYSAKCRRVFAGAHDFNIHSISINSDGETFVSADDLRINLWNLEITSQCFRILDTKPSDMEDLVEVITAAEFSPSSCNLMAYGGSRGLVRLIDLRQSALGDHGNARILYDDHGHHQPRSFFSEMASCISDIKFTKDGRHILIRDYMNLKLFDLHKESSPVATYEMHEFLRPKLFELYNNDTIFDKFNCCISGDGNYFCSGSYSNKVKVFAHGVDAIDGVMTVGAAMASRSSNRSSVSDQNVHHRRAARLFSSFRVHHENSTEGTKSADESSFNCDLKLKVLHLAWHPHENFIVSAAQSKLYMHNA